MSTYQKLTLFAVVLVPMLTLATLFRYDIQNTPTGYLKHDRWTGHIEACRVINKNRFKGGQGDYVTECLDMSS